MPNTVLTVPNRKGYTLTPNVNRAFCELYSGDAVGVGVFAVLVSVFETRIAFIFVGFFSPL